MPLILHEFGRIVYRFVLNISGRVLQSFKPIVTDLIELDFLRLLSKFDENKSGRGSEIIKICLRVMKKFVKALKSFKVS